MGTVVYSCPFVPAEWIAAHGFDPVRVMPPTVDGGPTAGAHEGVCPYAAAVTAELWSRADADLNVVTTLCDQRRRLAESMARHTDQAAFVMAVPATWRTPAASGLYRDELVRLGRRLVDMGGRRPSDEELACVMATYDDARAALRSASGLLPPRQFADAIGRFGAEGPAAVPRELPKPAPPPVGPAIALVGAPLSAAGLELYDVIADVGGHVVLDATDTGERTLPAPFDRRRLAADPLGELVDAYFGTISHAFRRPNSQLYEYLRRQFAVRAVRGVIFVRYIWCDIWHAELRRLAEWTEARVLDLDIADEGPDHARTVGRVQAFLETLA